MKVKEAIVELKLEPEDRIFIHYYGKVGDETCLIQDLDKNILKKKIKKIYGNYGGKAYGYSCYRFILE